MDIDRTSLHQLVRQVMWRLMHASMAGLWRYAKDHGLSMTHMVLLRQVHAGMHGGCNVSLISERMGLTSAAVSQALDRLVDQGLVSRTEDPLDRRSKRIQLTAEGERLLAESMQAQQAWVAGLLGRLSIQEEEVVRKSFELLAAKLEQME